MVSFTILAGGYTTFISTLIFQSSPPSLTVSSISQAGSNPSWIQASPLNSSVLYATNENTNGQFLSFRINPDGSLTEMASISSGGNGPAFGAPMADGLQAVVLNYNSGTGEFVTINSDLTSFTNGNGNPHQVTFTPPAGGQSHPHFALAYNNETFISDLGSDKIWRLALSQSNVPTITGYIPQPTGSGPRRAVISGSTIYVLHELQNTLTQQTIPTSPSTTTAPIISSLSVVPSVVAPPNNSTYHAGELLRPTPNTLFPTEYLYASNRNTATTLDPRGDTIAIFSTNPLTLVAQVYTGVNEIRGMEFGGDNDEYLVVGGQTGGGVVVFERTAGGGNLTMVAGSVDTNAMGRTSFVWV